MTQRPNRFSIVLALTALAAARGSVEAQCPLEPALRNTIGSGRVTCPCFAPGEQAGAVFVAPAEDYPIEVLRVGIGWGSAGGGSPDTLEAAIHVYSAGLPDPGAPIATLEGPVMTDGAINEHDFEVLPGEVAIESGPFTVALEFLNPSTVLGPSVVHDGDGCRAGRNVIFAVPGVWLDACVAGVTGDWVVHVVYRKLGCEGGDETFLRGDVNQSGKLNVTDVIAILAHLFLGGPAPCLDAADVNDDGELDVSDPIAAIFGLFLDGFQIPPPFPTCGEDPGPASLGCEAATTGCP